jgi:membrane protein
MGDADDEIAGNRSPRSRVERARVRTAALQARAEHISRRAQAERARHRSVDVVFDVAERDAEVGGGIIAAALAYRLFIWLLPVALVAVVGLGIAADAESESPEQAAEQLGVAGLVSSSVANAADSPNRWYALVIGIPLLVWATRGLLRVLIGAHRLVWLDVRAGAPRPTLLATLRLLALLLCYGVVTTFATAVRAWSGGVGLLSTLLLAIPYAAIWLLVTLRLPHRDAVWTALIPGCVVFGIGVESLHVLAAYAFAPWAASRQGTYGALGIAAALLFGLFLVSRLIVAAAVLNATLRDRRQPSG